INWHRNDFYNTPDPVNFDNHFNGNDYSLTGVHGWTDNQEGSFGSVLLFDFIQQFSNTGSYEEPFVMENFVAEELFPAGTDLCTQVLDLSNLQGDDLVQGNNHIAGWTACEANVNKQTYEIVRNRYKNLGQYLKNTKSNREDRLIDRRY
ncbi:MAG: hypothetical protein HKO80_08620, partial [Flavobacteriaceae bacterium]|nr:hypothetical protein [Flavobacteriaceae bacterium]